MADEASLEQLSAQRERWNAHYNTNHGGEAWQYPRVRTVDTSESDEANEDGGEVYCWSSVRSMMSHELPMHLQILFEDEVEILDMRLCTADDEGRDAQMYISRVLEDTRKTRLRFVVKSDPKDAMIHLVVSELLVDSAEEEIIHNKKYPIHLHGCLTPGFTLTHKTWQGRLGCRIWTPGPSPHSLFSRPPFDHGEGSVEDLVLNHHFFQLSKVSDDDGVWKYPAVRRHPLSQYRSNRNEEALFQNPSPEMGGEALPFQLQLFFLEDSMEICSAHLFKPTETLGCNTVEYVSRIFGNDKIPHAASQRFRVRLIVSVCDNGMLTIRRSRLYCDRCGTKKVLPEEIPDSETQHPTYAEDYPGFELVRGILDGPIGFRIWVPQWDHSRPCVPWQPPVVPPQTLQEMLLTGDVPVNPPKKKAWDGGAMVLVSEDEGRKRWLPFWFHVYFREPTAKVFAKRLSKPRSSRTENHVEFVSACFAADDLRRVVFRARVCSARRMVLMASEDYLAKDGEGHHDVPLYEEEIVDFSDKWQQGFVLHSFEHSCGLGWRIWIPRY